MGVCVARDRGHLRSVEWFEQEDCGGALKWQVRAMKKMRQFVRSNRIVSIRIREYLLNTESLYCYHGCMRCRSYSFEIMESDGSIITKRFWESEDLKDICDVSSMDSKEFYSLLCFWDWRHLDTIQYTPASEFDKFYTDLRDTTCWGCGQTRCDRVLAGIRKLQKHWIAYMYRPGGDYMTRIRAASLKAGLIAP